MATKEYKVFGMHCEKCSGELEKELNQRQKSNPIRLDYQNGTIEVPEDLDLLDLQRRLSFEKIFIVTDEGRKRWEEEHEHDDHDGHSHSHDFSGHSSTWRIGLVFALNLVFSIIEFIAGTLFNSAAILADAVHDLGDALSIGLAWVFQRISDNHPNSKHTFGYQRFSLLGALITSIVLVVGSILMLFHAVPLLFDPQVVNYDGMFWLAIFAILANGFSAWLLNRGQSINEGLLSVHVLEDLFGWVAVLIVSIVLQFTDWYFLDPLISVGIASWILYQTVPQFIEIIEIFLNAVPDQDMYADVKKQVEELAGINGISHLHIWSIDGEENAMTVTISTSHEKQEDVERIKAQMRDIILPYDITHSTIEVVYDPDQDLTGTHMKG